MGIGIIGGLLNNKGLLCLPDYHQVIKNHYRWIVNISTGKVTGKISIKNYIIKWYADECRWGRGVIAKDKFALLTGLNKTHIKQWSSVIGNIHESPELVEEGNNESSS